MSAIELRGASKAFGTTRVLERIDLEVPERSITAVLGASGSGKTTLLRLIAGFEALDGGSITIGSRLVDDGSRSVPAQHRGVGYVPQEGALFPHLTVAANVAFGIKRKARKLDDTTGELLEMVGLAGMGDRYPHQLSGGQQQRVALARALAIRPALVLLDEPFSSLDAGMRSSVRSDVQDVLRSGGITAVLVTHDQDEALSVADQVAVIRRGTIGQCGSPQELYDHPVDPGMAQFLGDANLVTATVDGDRVTTPFGPLELRADPKVTSPSGPAVALVRPEQLILSTTLSGAGLRARVVRTEFHGHDTVITVTPHPSAPGDPITVRADGDLVVADGTEVEVSAEGSALAWSAPVG
ncbi:MAG TPA: ABC transporter ATP-binding protein [Acidimicrobiales bacterium]|nr:ABC transporter ATP-binding protein [Acidimicrobiales bacterium]